MNTAERSISIDLLNLLLTLDRETGFLYWNSRPSSLATGKTRNPVSAINAWNSKNAGKQAFTASHRNHLYGSIFGKNYFAHRVVFALHYGRWPDSEIDHIDGNGFNNKPQNLRDVVRAENMKNICINSRNTSGITGVSFCKSRRMYEAYIHANGDRVFLGYFGSINDAIAKRESAKARYGYHENHGRKAA